MKSLAQQLDQLVVEQHVLVTREDLNPPIFRIIIPPSLVEEVIYDAHEGVGASHEGVGKTIQRILHFAYWPGMRRDVKLFIAACPACDKFRNVPHGVRAPLGSIRATNRFDLVAMDIVGGQNTLPETEQASKFILVMVDVFTKYLVACPLSDQLASSVGRA